MCRSADLVGLCEGVGRRGRVSRSILMMGRASVFLHIPDRPCCWEGEAGGKGQGK